MAEEPQKHEEPEEYSFAPKDERKPAEPASSAFDAIPTRKRPSEEEAEPEYEENAYDGPPPEPAERNLAMTAHLLGIATALGPLIFRFAKPTESAFVNDQSKEALNFQITLLIGWIIAVVATFTCLGQLLLVAVQITSIFSCLIAAIGAKEGKAYRYPYSLRLIK